MTILYLARLLALFDPGQTFRRKICMEQEGILIQPASSTKSAPAIREMINVAARLIFVTTSAQILNKCKN